MCIFLYFISFSPTDFSHFNKMMGLIALGNNPMVGATVACAVAVEESAK